MIRLVLVLLFLIIVWLLFIARLSRIQRVVAVVVMCILFAGAVWFDDNRKRPKASILSAEDIISCGIQATPQYRSNYNFDLCFKNLASSGTVRRLIFDVQASSCITQPCEVIESVSREIPIVIRAGAMLSVEESLKFDKVSSFNEQVLWSITIKGVKATPE